MDETKQEDSLDRQLREAAPYIDDEGFTKRVVAKLPAQRRQRRSLRAIILVGIALLGSTLAYVLSDGGKFINSNMEWLARLPILFLLLLMLVTGILVTVGGTLAAISKSRELQS
jgi:hypothetical protein